MNWRRGLFRLWVVGTALFVIAVAFISYSEIKTEFDVAAGKRRAASDLATTPKLSEWLHQRFYSDMPREQFDKKITTANPITEPKVIAQLEAIFRNTDTYRPVPEWTEDEQWTSTNPEKAHTRDAPIISTASGMPNAMLAHILCGRGLFRP